MPAQAFAETSLQRENINVFDGGGANSRIRSLATAPLGLTNANPIGGAISGARKTLAFHKSLQQINQMAVFALPIPVQASADSPKDMTGQVAHAHPGQNQKTRVVGHVRQGHLPTPSIPAHILIAGSTLPGWSPEQHTGKQPFLSVPH